MVLQRKLTVGAADDQYEQEADRVARQVLNTSDAVVANSMQRAMSPEEDKDPMLQTKPLAASITPFMQRQMVHNAASEDEEQPVQAKFLTETRRAPLQRQPETEEEETEPIQAKSAGALTESFEAGADVETQVSQSKGRGSPLPDPVRAYMEPRFGVDFSQVRVHTGSDALQMNQAVGAQAFTHGSDIYFGAGSSPTNLELTAHELTHVVQQTGGGPFQTKKREDEGAPPGPEPSIQRICAACAADDREAKGSAPISSQTTSTAHASPSVTPSVASHINRMQGGGIHLPKADRNFKGTFSPAPLGATPQSHQSASGLCCEQRGSRSALTDGNTAAELEAERAAAAHGDDVAVIRERAGAIAPLPIDTPGEYPSANSAAINAVPSGSQENGSHVEPVQNQDSPISEVLQRVAAVPAREVSSAATKLLSTSVNALLRGRKIMRTELPVEVVEAVNARRTRVRSAVTGLSPTAVRTTPARGTGRRPRHSDGIPSGGNLLNKGDLSLSGPMEIRGKNATLPAVQSGAPIEAAGGIPVYDSSGGVSKSATTPAPGAVPTPTAIPPPTPSATSDMTPAFPPFIPVSAPRTTGAQTGGGGAAASPWAANGAMGLIARAVAQTVGTALNQVGGMFGMGGGQTAPAAPSTSTPTTVTPPKVGDTTSKSSTLGAPQPVSDAKTPAAEAKPAPAGVYTSTTTPTPSSANVPAVAGVESIQSKIADLIKLKPKKDAYGEENAADRATIIKSIKEIREAIAALKASDLGMNTDQLQALKAQFYLQINKATPSYFQMENLDILWMMDKGKRATAPGRTCNVTALSISLESLGISPKEFKGDRELLKLIWKYQQDQMSEISKKDEETAISKLKGKTKENQEADLRAKGEKERTRLAALDLDGLRMPDFMQLIVIYNVLLKSGQVTGKMNGLGLDAGTIKAMAAGQPDKFKETMDSAHGLARNSILFSGQFPDFAGWFGIKANSRRIKYSDQLDKMGAFGRARWKVQELQGQLSETEQKANSVEGKSKARLEKEAKYLRGNIDTRKSKIDYTITEQEQELASLRAKAGRATGDEQATLTAQADRLAATIEARKGKQQDKITKMEAELEKLKGQQTEGAKGKAAAALEKKIKAKQGQIDELKSPTSIQSMDQFETMVPLKDYKDEVTGVFVPILSAGKHVEVNLHNHFVHLFEINDNGPVVDEVGEGAGKRLQLSWEKARALGYFQSSTVYEK